MKGVGEKLFGGNAADESLKASALLQKVKSLGLDYQSLTIKTSGSTVILEGAVDEQSDAEKIALAVGNVDGVDAVDNRMTVSNPQPEAQYHTVQSGESLSQIAQQYYGDMMQYPKIFEANKPMLADPDQIFPGQVLRIPA